eukprot:COSAG04_NODE_25233_length_310_cov_0.981043_1_plen_69_part_10
MPVGAHAWWCWVNLAEGESEAEYEWIEHTLTTTLLPTKADVVAAEQRIQAAFEAAQAPKAAAATEQLAQ